MSKALTIPTRIRCIAMHSGKVCTAVTLEFGLAAQGDSFEEVKLKLEEQIHDYLETALKEAPQFAAILLARRAPVWVFLAWHASKLIKKLHLPKPVPRGRRFTEPTPQLTLAA